MFNLTKKLLRAEGRFIDLLTGFCWWTEIHFDKNNLYWAWFSSKISFAFAVVFLSMMSFYYYNKGDFLLMVPATILVLIFLFAFIFSIFFTKRCKKIYLKQAVKVFVQGFPNESRKNKRAFRVRLIIAYFLILFVAFFEENYFRSVMMIIFSGFFLFDILEKYFLSCDLLRRSEKVRRKDLYGIL